LSGLKPEISFCKSKNHQRLLRVKRLLIKLFSPSNNINSYLDLQRRIEQRMAAMKLAGSEVGAQISDSFKEMIHDESLD
jgi:hypothetical protein